MNRPHWPGLLSGLFLIFVLHPALASEDSISARHRASLDTYRSEYVRAFRDENADAIVSRYAENVRIMPPYHGTVFGIDGARSYHRAFFERFQVREYRRHELQILDLGSRLIEIGRFAMSLALANGAQVDEITGSYMDIWQSAPGRTFAQVTHVWNTDTYPAIAHDFGFSGVPSVRTAFEAHVPVKGGLSFELAALNKLHEAAVSQHDDQVWSQFFAEDAVLLANQHGLVAGRAAIGAYLAQHVKEMPVFEKLDIRNDEIDSVGRYVIEYASHVANWRNGDSSGVNTGKNIRVWRRESEGSLKMICGIGTYD
jgi:ketosteroid isomerase-like protein